MRGFRITFLVCAILILNVLSGEKAFGQLEYPGPVDLLTDPEEVFNWRTDSAEYDNTPDAPPRAWRGADDTIYLTIGHYTSYRMSGSDFNTLTVDDSAPIHTSHYDTDQTQHNYKEWLSSIYTEDGTTIHGIVHNENQNFDNVYTSLTYASSSDGGASFSHVSAPDHLIIGVDTARSDTYRIGVIEPTNIIKHDGYYYFIAEAWGDDVERNPYLFRTDDLSDPDSWRGWDGSDFTVVLGDPYTENPDYSAMKPLNYGTPWEGNTAYMHSSLTYNTYFEKFMLVAATQKGDDWGIYYSLSEDLINWSQRILIRTFDNASVGQGDPTASTSNDHVYYPTLIDHDDTSRNFEYTDQEVYLYYVRTIAEPDAGDDYKWDRKLMRQKISFNKRLVDGFEVTRAGDLEDEYQGDGIATTSAGHTSLRSALLESRYRPPYYQDSVITITFNFGTSNHTITPGSLFLGPTFPVIIDGRTQSGYSANTQSLEEGTNTTWDVAITGDYATLNLEGNHSKVYGLEVENIDISGDSIEVGASSVGRITISGTAAHIGGTDAASRNLLGSVQLNGTGATDVTIENNYIGVDATGETGLNDSNILVEVAGGASDNLVKENIISGSGYIGVQISDANTTGNSISGNLIGLDRNGNGLGNANSGISIKNGATQTLITGNSIGANGGEAGIYVLDNNDVTITANYIGTTSGGANVGNTGDGIWISGSSQQVLVGGTDASDGNVVANNGGNGISLLSLTGGGHQILGNLVYDNSDDNIGPISHLSPASITPYVTYYDSSTDSLHIYFSTDATDGTYRVEAFENSSDTKSAGEIFLGADSVTTGSDAVSFTSIAVAGNSSDAYVALTITNTSTTSSFSDVIPIYTSTTSPQIRVDSIPDFILDDAQAQTETQPLIYTNTGANTLSWEVEDTTAWLGFEPSAGSLAAGETDTIQVTADARELSVGDYLSKVSIYSNDATSPHTEVEISMTYQSADTDPPSAPQALQGSYANNSNALSWDAVSASDLSHYKIYRGDMWPFGFASDNVLADSITTTSYEDEDIQANQTYHYVVMAVDNSGNESDPSNNISIAVGTMDTTPPGIPSGLNISKNDTSLVVSWNSVSASDLSHYRIYRGTASGFNADDNSRLSDSLALTTFYDTDVAENTTYYYVVTSVDESGNESNTSSEVSGSFTLTALDDVFGEQPTQITLEQNYPNPFNPSTIIRFGLPTTSPVHLEITDIAGHRVALLVNETKSAGWHVVRFNASQLASGVYFYKLITPNQVQTKQMMFIK